MESHFDVVRPQTPSPGINDQDIDYGYARALNLNQISGLSFECLRYYNAGFRMILIEDPFVVICFKIVTLDEEVAERARAGATDCTGPAIEIPKMIIEKLAPGYILEVGPGQALRVVCMWV